LVKITDPNHGAWSFAYTPAGRLKSGKDPLGRGTSFTYDPSTGRLASVALPEGGTCAIERDEGGRVIRANFSGSVGPDLHYGYDALGRLSATTGVALTRDAEGQITNSAQAGRGFLSQL
jgi:YD repeat-containing protein